MQWVRGRRKSGGFTLMEILIVVGILMLLAGLLLPILGAVRIQALRASSRATLDGLARCIEQYKMICGSYPLKTAADGTVDFYQVPCVAKGQLKDGSEDNSELIRTLSTVSHFDCKRTNVVNGRLVDDFGSPVIVRFVRYANGDQSMVRVYVWSYGPDQKNGIDASPTFQSNPASPYDQAELDKIEASITAGSDDILPK